ncbi:N-terminal domain of peptidoglycan hydrolase CwlO-containing protein [Amphibacillus marinus]|uniref:N-terminal domain of peptidoglycan hydrolase CwlO-containing protein n=1 Tax=Amphibacillus marinus TaxID=872970 RepID=A0A1H8Q738_9BACI|nr:C40 family peptidase [Amphibacillus marinus]SEO49838.1 N-terminal domain of peptidoglycan hydrolase CwlO-containing protein [Amphibacillus marinus]
MNSKKVVTSLALSIGILLSAPSFGSVLLAETESELASNRAALQTELEEKRAELEEIQTGLVDLQEEIDRTNEAIAANEQAIKETEEQVEEKEAEIAELEVEIERLEADIEMREEILKDRAVSLQKNGGGINYLDVLLGSQSFTDFVDRISLVTKIAQSDQNLIEQLEADQKAVEDHKATVENKLAELNDTKAELEMMQQHVLEQKAELEADVAELEEKQARSQAIITELELEDQELQRLIDNARAEAERRRQAAIAEVQSEVVQFSAAAPSTNNSAPAATASAGSGAVSDAISAGYKYIGNSTYKFGGGRTQSDISRGLFDCSGFVSWAFSQAGISIAAQTDALANTGTKVSTSEMKPGDLVFFNTYKTNGHVGIYIGNNQFIGSQSSTGVAIASMSSGYWADTFNGLVRRVK